MSPTACRADSDTDLGAGDFRINGFGTAGIAQIEAPDHWAYIRDLSQAQNSSATRVDLDSRVGVQMNYAPNAQYELVSQFVASHVSPAANASDLITLAFGAYRPDANWTIRAGRINFDAYLMADHRDVGFAYEFARPPVDFYDQLPTFLDGVDVSHVWDQKGTLWRLKGLLGTTSVASETFRINGIKAVGIIFSRQQAALLLRASVIRGILGNAPTPITTLSDALQQLTTTIPVADVAREAGELRRALAFHVYTSYFALGAEYEHADWLWSSEVTRVTGARGFDAGYGSFGRRLGAVSVYGIASAVSFVQTPTSTPNWAAELTPVIGPDAAAQVQALGTAAAFAANSLAARQHTASIGARWNLNPRLALKGQWDHVWIRADGAALWDNATLEAAQANIYSCVLDFIF